MLVFYSGRGIAITPSRGTAVRCAFSAHFARGKTRRKQSVVAVHHTGQQPSSLRLGCVRSRVQISPSRPFSFPPFPFPGIYNKRRQRTGTHRKGASAPHAELARGKIAALRARACTGQLQSLPAASARSTLAAGGQKGYC